MQTKPHTWLCLHLLFLRFLIQHALPEGGIVLHQLDFTFHLLLILAGIVNVRRFGRLNLQ